MFRAGASELAAQSVRLPHSAAFWFVGVIAAVSSKWASALAQKRQKEVEGGATNTLVRAWMISSTRKGVSDEAQARAIREVVAWRFAQAMKKKISRSRMAALLKTSRTQVDHLLDPRNDIILSNLQRAAAMAGRRVTIELV